MDEESFLDRIDRLLSPETPEEIARDFAMGAHPVTGTAMDAGNFLMGIRNRDIPRAGISALAALLPFIGAGTLRRVGEGAARKFIGKQPPQVGRLGSEGRPRGIKSDPMAQSVALGTPIHMRNLISGTITTHTLST